MKTKSGSPSVLVSRLIGQLEPLIGFRNDPRFTKPLQAASQLTSASIFDRLKSIDSEIETLRQERQALIARLEIVAREKEEE